MTPRAIVSEALGTALLVATVIGSAIMAQALTQDVGVLLLANALVTGAMLFVLVKSDPTLGFATSAVLGGLILSTFVTLRYLRCSSGRSSTAFVGR